MRELTKEAHQINKALDTLQPRERKRAAAKKEIEAAFNFLNRVVASRNELLSKELQKDLIKLIDYLIECWKLLKRHPEWESNPLVNVNKQLEDCIEELHFRSRPSRRTAPRQKFAVMLARNLIDKYRPGEKKAVGLSRGNCWHTLSAILAGGGPRPVGHPLPDLMTYMEKFNRSPMPVNNFILWGLENSADYD